MHEEFKKALIIFFFEMRQNIYLYHLSTYEYSRHIAAGDLIDKLDDLIDRFLEVYFGKYGRPDMFTNSAVPLIPLSDDDAYLKLSYYVNELTNTIPTMINLESDSDLLTIRDEMLVLINSAKYLFKLR
jgi:hypothetical protein